MKKNKIFLMNYFITFAKPKNVEKNVLDIRISFLFR